MDFVLHTCARYGEEFNQLLLSYASEFPLSAQNFLNVIDRMSVTENLQALSSWGRILAGVCAEWLEKYRAKINEKCKLSKNVANKIDWRLKISSYSPAQAWGALREYNENCKKKDRNMNEVDSAYVDCLLNSLSNTNLPPDEKVCQTLSDEGLRGEWLELWMIELAGLRKIPRAMLPLVKKLQTDTDYLRQKTINAIVRIGNPRAINLIDKTFADDRWDLRLCSLNVPARLKCTRSEEFFLHHLKHEKDVSIRTYLSGGLCGLFSKRGVDVVREEIHNGYDHGALPLPYLLTDMTEILSIPLPNGFFGKWSVDMKRSGRHTNGKINIKKGCGKQRKFGKIKKQTNMSYPKTNPNPSAAKSPKSAATTRARAAAGENIKNAAIRLNDILARNIQASLSRYIFQSGITSSSNALKRSLCRRSKKCSISCTSI